MVRGQYYGIDHLYGISGLFGIPLPFVTAVLALLAGNLIGGIFMALHSAQGPMTGVPQMIQTRGQFGSFGSLFVVTLVILMYLGFFASNAVLGAQTLNTLVKNIPVDTGIVIMGCASLIAAIFGYKLIHMYARIITIGSGLAMTAVFLMIIFQHRLPADFLIRGNNSMAGILGTVSIGALWQLAYAPYVSDYSRYMPRDTGAKAAFWSSYWGCILGTMFPMVLGVAVAAAYNGDIVSGILFLSGNSIISLAAVLMFTIAIICSNAMNLYCGTMSSITVIQTLIPRFNPKISARVITGSVLFLITLGVAIWGKNNFLVNYSNFIFILLYVLIPWTAINLVDYYAIRHGHYDIASFFRRDGGIYGFFNKTALFSYALGIFIQIPFMSTTLYTGYLAGMMDGADISWLVGLMTVSPLYYFLEKRKQKN